MAHAAPATLLISEHTEEGATSSSNGVDLRKFPLRCASLSVACILRESVYVLSLDITGTRKTLPAADLTKIGSLVSLLASKRKAIVFVVPFDAFVAADMLKLSGAIARNGGTLQERQEDQTTAMFVKEFRSDFEQTMALATAPRNSD